MEPTQAASAALTSTRSCLPTRRFHRNLPRQRSCRSRYPSIRYGGRGFSTCASEGDVCPIAGAEEQLGTVCPTLSTFILSGEWRYVCAILKPKLKEIEARRDEWGVFAFETLWCNFWHQNWEKTTP